MSMSERRTASQIRPDWTRQVLAGSDQSSIYDWVVMETRISQHLSNYSVRQATSRLCASSGDVTSRLTQRLTSHVS